MPPPALALAGWLVLVLVLGAEAAFKLSLALHLRRRGEPGRAGLPPEELRQRFPKSVAAVLSERFASEEVVRVGAGQRWLLAPRPDAARCFT